MFEPWMKWTFWQAMTGTFSRIMQKVVGNLSRNLVHTVYSTFLVGVVQMTVAWILARRSRTSLWVGKAGIGWSIAFGCGAFFSTVLSFMTFVEGGDVGVSTFLVTLSIVPGAFIDRYFFHRRLEAIQLLGVLVAIIAGYAVLGAPSLKELQSLPLWMWLALANSLTVAANQGFSQAIGKIDGVVSNFWVGLVTTVLGMLGLVSFRSFGSLVQYSHLKGLTLASLVIGVIVFLAFWFNVLAYRDGAKITTKKLVFNAVWLITSVIAGITLFHERLALVQIVGMILFIIGFALLQKKGPAD